MPNDKTKTKNSQKNSNNSWQVVVLFLVLIGLIFAVERYFFYLTELRNKYAIKEVLLYSARLDLEKFGQKQLAYSECVVHTKFTDMLLPWLLQNQIDELDSKIKICNEKVTQLQSSHPEP